MQGFKVKPVSQYMERLQRLAADATLREELTSFPLAKDAEEGVAAEHRAGAALSSCVLVA